MQSERTTERATWYRWVVAGLVFFITLVNFIDRSAISYAIVPLKQEFHLTDAQFGFILTAFGIGYMLLTAFGGWLVDLYGSRKIWPIAAISWSLCVAFIGLVTGFWGFIILRFLLGVTEGPHFPAMSRTISDWLPARERATALSIGLVAIPLSSAIGAPITSSLIVDYGWRVMFFSISAIGIIWAFVWYFVFRDKPEDSKYVNSKELQLISATRAGKTEIENTNIDWRFILTHPALVANNISYFAFGYMLFFATLWLPGYFLQEHNLNLKSVGWYLTIPWLVAAIFLKAGGILSDWLYKKTGSRRISRSHIIWVSQLLAAICFVLSSFTHTLGLCIFFLSLGLGFGFMPQSAFFSVNIDVAKERAASSQGITSGCLAFAGILAPSLTGWVIELTGSYQTAFLILAGFTAIGVLTVILFHHPDREWTPSLKKRLA